MPDAPQIELYETKDPFPMIFQVAPDLFDTGFLDIKCAKQSIEDEERLTAAQDAFVASGTFERGRRNFRDLFRGMLEGVFDHFDIKRKDGVDIGSGMSGEMVHQLLPLTEEEKVSWTECEINPGSVNALKERYPSAQIHRASYLRLREGLELNKGVDTITGLSSLDATNHLGHAISEIRKSLAVGGFLVHMQDVRPGVNHPINVLKQHGVNRPYPCAIQKYGPPLLPGMVPNPHGFVLGNEIHSSMELFRYAIGQTISREDGLRMLYNTWLLAKGPFEESDELSQYYMGMVQPRTIHDTRKKAYAIVTVAQRTK